MFMLFILSKEELRINKNISYKNINKQFTCLSYDSINFILFSLLYLFPWDRNYIASVQFIHACISLDARVARLVMDLYRYTRVA